MSHRAILLAAVVAFAGWLAPTPAQAENRIALVIGNSSYETVSVLPNPENDARAMSELLTAAGFEVIAAPNLTLDRMRQTIGAFARTTADKGPDTVALVFYAGHGLQVDGENFLVPVDARIEREADVPLQAMRLADVMNMLSAVRSKTRIVILDACRNNPFSEINKTSGRGLAIVDAPNGSIVSYSTAPGTEAQDGDGVNSPYTTALLKAAREPGVPIEQALKRVRSSVHESTRFTQTPWESSSLTDDFYFFPTGATAGERPAPATSARPVSTGADRAAAARRSAGKSVDSWKKDLRGQKPADAYTVVIEEGTPEAFEAYLAVYTVAPYAGRVRTLLDRRREMTAWYAAVQVNTTGSFELFLATYPNSDLALTAQRLLERARDRAISSMAALTPLCPPAVQPAPTRRTMAPEPKKQVTRTPPEPKVKKRATKSGFISDEEVRRSGGPGPGERATTGGPPISIGIGVGIPIRGLGGGHRSIPSGGGHHAVPSSGGHAPVKSIPGGLGGFHRD